MNLFEFISIVQEDYDTYDTVFDAEVTANFIEKEKDNYDKFCNGIIKKVKVIRGNGNRGVIVNWTDLIKNNMEKFKEFTKEHWWEDCQYEDDEDDFIYQWIIEIHNYMSGNVSEDFYKNLIELVDSLEFKE